VCICSSRYPACNAHAPYCYMWPVPLYNIFPYYIKKNSTIFQTKMLSTKCAFQVSLQLLSQTFFILRRNEQDTIKYVQWSSCNVPFILVRIQRNFNSLDRFFKNTRISNFMKIRLVGAELFHTYRRDEANTRLSQFWKRALKCTDF